jgi:hypothetical protein
MSWEDVPQDVMKPKRAISSPCSLALAQRRGGQVRLHLSVAGDLARELGWQAGTRLHLQVGRAGKALGWLRIKPTEDQAAGERQLRKLPRSDFFSIPLLPPEDLAGIVADRAEAEYQVAGGNTLLVQLPWDLSQAAPAPAEAA